MWGEDSEIQAVIDEFWGRRNKLAAMHMETGVQGGAARSGAHMAGVQGHVRSLFVRAGLPELSVLPGSPSLPGYFRRSKSWDVVVVYKGALVAAIELKSQVGSVGNNANNRIEEAIGNAFDVGASQRNNAAFGAIPPWLGFVMVLEESPKTQAVLRNGTVPFPVDPAFIDVTYSKQYQIALSRFVSDGLYDAGWFLTTSLRSDDTYGYREPLPTATADTFAGLVQARVDFVKKVLG